MRSVRKTKSRYRAKERVLTHKDHGADVTDALSTVVGNAAYADVKIVCSAVGGVFWSHKIILAAVSPFLKTLLLGSEDDGSVLTLHLPQVAAAHVRLVLDYVYTGAMYLRADQLASVVRVFEMLRMKCGVSVSKMVAVEEQAKSGSNKKKNRSTKTTMWVEEAEFQGFEELKTDIKEEENIDEEFSLSSCHKVEGSTASREDSMSTGKSADSAQELATLHEISDSIIGASAVEDEEPPVEVRPVALSDNQRKLTREYSVVEVDEESDSEDEADFGINDASCADTPAIKEALDTFSSSNSQNERSLFRCIMCEKVFRHSDNLKVHLQSHLGARAKLNSCGLCRRNFRSSLEHELHVNAHRIARHPAMKAHTTPKNPLVNSLRQRLVRRALKAAMARQAAATAAAVAALKKDRAAERRESKMIKGKKSPKRGPGRPKKRKEPKDKKVLNVRRHERSLARDPFKLKMKIRLEPVRLLEYEKRRQTQKRKIIPSNTYCGPCRKSFPTSASLGRHARLMHEGKGRRKKKRKSSSSWHEDEAAPKQVRQSADERLMCSTCDKVFVARSILERHLKTSGHGGSDNWDLKPQAPGPGFVVGPSVPHLNSVLQPKMEVGGLEVNKYECHLCHAVFVRVKDLAKHRERQCTAWSNVA